MRFVTNPVFVFFGLSAVYGFLILRRPSKRKPVGQKLPEFLPVLAELARAWEAVTEADIERWHGKLPDKTKTDVVLGTIYSAEARRTWALGQMMWAQCAEQKLRAQMASGEDAQFSMELAGRFDAMEDCARELFWTQAREEIGGDAWTEPGISLRKGWVLVAVRHTVPDSIKRMLGMEPPQ